MIRNQNEQRINPSPLIKAFAFFILLCSTKSLLTPLNYLGFFQKKLSLLINQKLKRLRSLFITIDD